MTINVAFKTPDSLVFVTDGLATLSSVDEETGDEHVVSSVPGVEKLVVLSPERPIIAMFNGIGSLGGGNIASELRSFEIREGARGSGESILAYARRLSSYLIKVAEERLQATPVPFHLILGGMGEGEDLHPEIYEIRWTRSGKIHASPQPVLHALLSDRPARHRFGSFYAGATAAVARFVEGFDPMLPEDAVALLAGLGKPDAPPGILKELIGEARSQGKTGDEEPLSAEAIEDMALRYAGRIVETLFVPEEASLSEHFSLQAAVNYAVFLAQCAYARENWSPARIGPPRVGSALQVVYVSRGVPATALARIKLGVAIPTTEERAS